MKAKDVPQDDSILEGNRRACYAEDENGRYVIVPSKGWEVEKIVNAQAHSEINHKVEEARQEVSRGKVSPLKYHMIRHQMTPGILSAATGFWRFQVYYHLRPRGFSRLRNIDMGRYADAIGITINELKIIPDYREQE